MAYIRPSSDLRNKYNEISEFCNRYNEPVFITKNGTGDLVVLSNAEYERLCGKQELYRLLDEGIADIKNGKCRTAEDTFADIEKRFGFGNV
ncbi:MAG: type II toxin-antitoxin system prevent-host-death family antitoxin [Clostridiales bacterium]|nr:type II toxin-antitoxin system prevent-host-death family antitoxin [Clostridiales bacterium]